MDNDLITRINCLIKQIDCALSDVNGKTVDEFSKSDLLVRATCFSLVQIGEQMIRIEEKLKDRYPDIPWIKAKRLRNLIVHIYNKVDAAQIYDTATRNLPELKESFVEIKNAIMSEVN